MIPYQQPRRFKLARRHITAPGTARKRISFTLQVNLNDLRKLDALHTRACVQLVDIEMNAIHS
jgi:hypothetical protein